jgi:hypothetical protein
VIAQCNSAAPGHLRWDVRGPPGSSSDSGIVGASRLRAWKALPRGEGVPAPRPNGQVRTDLKEPSLTARAWPKPRLITGNSMEVILPY